MYTLVGRPPTSSRLPSFAPPRLLAGALADPARPRRGAPPKCFRILVCAETNKALDGLRDRLLLLRDLARSVRPNEKWVQVR